MKVLIVFALVCVSFVICDVTKENCKCFEEFYPKEEFGEVNCRGDKNNRLFECGEEKPPACKCYVKGAEVILDVGETHCVDGIHTYDSENCDPASEWTAYFQRHPGRVQLYSVLPPKVQHKRKEKVTL
uniref:Uncharacterized protein LOC114339674 n=1 Tax=Diabrotica virgifera virgifera TaxID=50390 RepID=A0A6P7GA75_DIAVI